MSLFPLTRTDARGRTHVIDAPPRRIVSLVPSQTELLNYLGLDDRVVGLTRFCIRPKGWKRAKTVVGGTKQVDVDRIRALQPDLILANREENTRAMVEALDDLAPVFVTDVATVADACAMIETVGALTATAEPARALSEDIDQAFSTLDAYTTLRAAYLIWRRPYMSVGGDTFIHDVMRRGSLINVFGNRKRYPEISLDDVTRAQPDVVLLSSEPFPFREDHYAEFHDALPGVSLHLVDGELFSWYGPRLLQTPAYLRSLREQAFVG